MFLSWHTPFRFVLQLLESPTPLYCAIALSSLYRQPGEIERDAARFELVWVLQGSVEKYAAQKAEAGWYSALLERMTAMLVADARDKGHAAAIDDILKEGKPGDFNIQVCGRSVLLLSPHQSGRLRFKWLLY